MIDWVASMSQSDEPWPCWKTNTTTPNAAASETRLSSTALTASTIERNARVSRIRVRISTRASTYGEAAEQGVHEVAIDRGDAGERAVRALERGVGAVDDRLDAGRRAVDRGERLDQRGRPGLPRRGRVAPAMPGTVASVAAICCGSPPFSTSTFSGFMTPGLMPASASIWRPSIAVPLPGKFDELRLVGVQLRAEPGQHGDDRDADGGDGDRAPQHEACPAAPRAVLGAAAVDQPARHHADAVDALAEHGEHRRQQRDRGEHRDGRDQHAARGRSSGSAAAAGRPATAGRWRPSSRRRSPSGRRGSSSRRPPTRRRLPSRSSSRKRKIISSA